MLVSNSEAHTKASHIGVEAAAAAAEEEEEEEARLRWR